MAQFAYVTTNQLTIDGDATPDPITVPVDCRDVYVRPDLDNIMNGWYFYAPSALDTPIKLADGEGVPISSVTGAKTDKRGIIPAGTVVGYGKANTVGSWVFYIRCSL